MRRKAFHVYLKEVMRDNNWSQEQFAQKLETSQQNVHNWTSGKTDMPLRKFILLNKILGNDKILNFSFEHE